MTTFIDTSVIFSIRKGDEIYSKWSKETLEIAERPLVVSDMVFCELSAAAKDISEVQSILIDFNAERVSPPLSALFLAGQMFGEYKRNSGKREKLPSDFIIAAHAHSENCKLITTNPKDMKKYLPNIDLIFPPQS